MLQTLVIDVGFGTQDARGLDGLIEAIHAIERDFQIVLVITHIAELKEFFPTRIDVTRTPDGSRVRMN
jgi:exonuclease SbcC